MDTVKAVINIGDASIQLEGPQEFVEKYLNQYHPLIEKWHTLQPLRAAVTKISEVKEKEVAPAKRVRIVKPKVGASCSDRIRALINENYFAEQRRAGEVANWLKDQKGFTHTINQVTASLTNIIKSGDLRRLKEGGKYKYINP